MAELKNHDLLPGYEFRHIGYDKKPVLDREGNPIEGISQIWISLDNEKQLNSYTTDAVKEVILGFRRASVDRSASVVIFTGKGDRAFCTGGNTEEYATYYANRPLEYLQYMRLFNDMVTSILLCDKPVICRVNGMRIGGGQEIGMACDFSIAGDHARFGQAGPIHGSAPDGGSTDFLDEYVGYAKAAESLVICEPWSAHKSLRLGLINEIAPTHRAADGKYVANPFVVTDRYADELGNIVYGEWKTGAEKDQAKKAAAACTTDLSALDAAVDRVATKLTYTFPDCTQEDPREPAQEEARALAAEQRDEPLVALAEHEHRGRRGLPGVPVRRSQRARDRLHQAPAPARRGRTLRRRAGAGDHAQIGDRSHAGVKPCST